MTTFRIILTQITSHDFEVEARTFWAAVDLARNIQCGTAGPAYSLPDPDSAATDIVVACRTCGDTLHGDDGNEEALPGYCGPCSIPEQQDRERGRSTEGGPFCAVCGDDLTAERVSGVCEPCQEQADHPEAR